MTTLNDRILSVRICKGLSQLDFSKIIGISRSSLSEIENGKTRPSADLIVGITTGFSDINTDWLLTGKGEMYRQTEQPTASEPELNHAVGIVTPSAILNRMNLVSNTVGDAQLSKAMQESTNTLKQWRKNGQVPYEACEYMAEKYKVSLKWLITGFGDMNSKDTMDRRMYIMNQLMEALPDQQQQEILAAIKEKERINALERKIAALTNK